MHARRPPASLRPTSEDIRDENDSTITACLRIGAVQRWCAGRQQTRFQTLLVHLRRLDAVGLRPATRHHQKWADKYGIDIQFVQVNDYIESVNQYTAGGFDGCAMTNMDALTIPAVGGVDSTALIVGDYSNGNDGILIKGTNSLATLKGKPINLVQLSVSHYGWRERWKRTA